MRVYDVVSAKNQLTEEYTVVPRGKPPNKMYWVVDPETGKELSNHLTPGLARDAARNANAKIKADADQRAADAKAAADKAEQDKIKKVKRTNRIYLGLKVAAGTLGAIFSGISIAGSIDKHAKEQQALYDSYEAGNFGKKGAPEAVAAYEERSKVIYGTWVSQTAATVLASGAQAAIAAKIINGIKAARAAGMVATGAATAGAALPFWWLAGEAATFAAIWFINRASTIEWLIEYTWNAPGITKAMLVSAKFNPPASLDPNVDKDLKYAMDMSPRDKAGVGKEKDDFTSDKPPAAGAPARSSSAAPPASSTPPAASSSSEPARKNWAAGLD
jgi:hypothetical protein